MTLNIKMMWLYFCKYVENKTLIVIKINIITLEVGSYNGSDINFLLQTSILSLTKVISCHNSSSHNGHSTF